RDGWADTLHASLTIGNRTVGLTPACAPREDHVGKFGGLRIEQVLDDHKFQAAQQPHCAVAIGFAIHRVFAQHVAEFHFAVLHGLEHGAEVAAFRARNFDTVSALKLGAQLIVFDVLETRQPVGDRAHVAAALHVVLAAERVYAAAIATDVA